MRPSVGVIGIWITFSLLCSALQAQRLRPKWTIQSEPRCEMVCPNTVQGTHCKVLGEPINSRHAVLNLPSVPPPTNFFAPASGLPESDPHPPLPLQPGERPIVVVVTLAPREMVARTTVTWGYRDAAETFVQGGRDVFDYRGGVVFGVIPNGVEVNSVEIHARVDYVPAEVLDLDYILQPQVSDSGINAVVQTTANTAKQRLIFRSLGAVRADDYIVASFRSRSFDVLSPHEQRGSALLSATELLPAVSTIVQKVAEFPYRPGDRNNVDWVIHGRLQGKHVERKFSSENREAIEIFRNSLGELDVWLGPEAP